MTSRRWGSIYGTGTLVTETFGSEKWEKKGKENVGRLLVWGTVGENEGRYWRGWVVRWFPWYTRRGNSWATGSGQPYGYVNVGSVRLVGCECMSEDMWNGCSMMACIVLSMMGLSTSETKYSSRFISLLRGLKMVRVASIGHLLVSFSDDEYEFDRPCISPLHGWETCLLMRLGWEILLKDHSEWPKTSHSPRVETRKRNKIKNQGLRK